MRRDCFLSISEGCLGSQSWPWTGVKPDDGHWRTGIFRSVSWLALTADWRIPVRPQLSTGAFPFQCCSIFRTTVPTLTSSCQNRRVTGYIVGELAQSYYRKDVCC